MLALCRLPLSARIALLALLAALAYGGTSHAQYPSSYPSYPSYQAGYGQYPASYGYLRPGYPAPGVYPQPVSYPYPGSYPPFSGFGYGSFGTTTGGSYGSTSGSSSVTGIQAGIGDTPEQRQKQFDQCESWLKHVDGNHNGIIEASELTEGKSHSHKQIFEEVVQRAGIPPMVPMPISAVRERLVAIYRITPGMPGTTPGAPGSTPAATPKSPSTTSGQATSSASAAAGLVPGFAVAMNLPPVPAFGGPAWSASAFSASSSASSLAAATTGNAETDRKLREVATNVLQKYDANKNGQLEKDEWSRMKTDMKPADRNGDGIITRDELAAWFIQNSKRGRPDSPAPDSAASTASADKSGKSDKSAKSDKSDKPGKPNDAQPGPSCRFRTPLERLPKGLPDWFIDKDLDKDGQISMAEFAGQWTDDKAAEFAQYDLNGDGVVTAAECLQGLQLIKNELAKAAASKNESPASREQRMSRGRPSGFALTPSREPRGR